MLGCVLVTTVLGGAADEVRRFDNNRDEKTDRWEYYRDGALLRVEVERDSDSLMEQRLFRGQPNQWEYFTAGSKKPYKLDRDTNGEGKADPVWEKGGVCPEKPALRDGAYG